MNNGKVMAVDVTLYSNVGNSMDLSLSVSIVGFQWLKVHIAPSWPMLHITRLTSVTQSPKHVFNTQILERALFHMDNSYNIPSIRGTGYMCKTNLPSNSAFRGFGGPQGMMIAESWMSDVAHSCGLPAEEVRTATDAHTDILTMLSHATGSCSAFR